MLVGLLGYGVDFAHGVTRLRLLHHALVGTLEVDLHAVSYDWLGTRRLWLPLLTGVPFLEA